MAMTVGEGGRWFFLSRSSFPFFNFNFWLLISQGNQYPCNVGFQGQIFVHVRGDLRASPVRKENGRDSISGRPRVRLTEIQAD